MEVGMIILHIIKRYLSLFRSRLLKDTIERCIIIIVSGNTKSPESLLGPLTSFSLLQNLAELDSLNSRR